MVSYGTILHTSGHLFHLIAGVESSRPPPLPARPSGLVQEKEVHGLATVKAAEKRDAGSWECMGMVRIHFVRQLGVAGQDDLERDLRCFLGGGPACGERTRDHPRASSLAIIPSSCTASLELT